MWYASPFSCLCEFVAVVESFPESRGRGGTVTFSSLRRERIVAWYFSLDYNTVILYRYGFVLFNFRIDTWFSGGPPRDENLVNFLRLIRSMLYLLRFEDCYSFWNLPVGLTETIRPLPSC